MQLVQDKMGTKEREGQGGRQYFEELFSRKEQKKIEAEGERMYGQGKFFV